MSTSCVEAFQSFPLKDNLSFTSFYKYIDEKYKHPYRLTDLYEYCELHKKLKVSIVNAINEIEDTCTPNPELYIPKVDSAKLLSYFEEHPNNANERIQSSKCLVISFIIYCNIQNLFLFKN